MIIYTAVWSDEYLRWMERGLIPSLRSPKNLEAIRGAHWLFNCPHEAERQRVRRAVDGVDCHVEFLADNLMDGAKKALGLAYAKSVPLLMAPPDTIFSENAVANLSMLAKPKGTAVASAHVRVLPSFLDNQPRLSPGAMVSHAWQHLHDSWVYSDRQTGESVCYWGGVFWQEIEAGIIAVQHRLPTVYMVNVTKEDMNFFNSSTIFGTWDGGWPSECLTKCGQERYRLIGSSDACFIVEVTHPGRNVPKKSQAIAGEPDAFHAQGTHHWINRLFVSIFRKEG